MMRAAEEGKKQWGMQCAHAQTGRYQGLEQREQGQVERVQPEAGIAGWAGPGFPGLAGFGLVQYVFLSLGVRGPGNQQKHLEYIVGSG